VAYVASGTIHAIGPDVLVGEINQNSDTTYRVYDYGRGRELHIDKALDVTNLELEGSLVKGLKNENDTFTHTYYCYDRNFSLERLTVHPEYKGQSDLERFHILSCVEGEGTIEANGTSLEFAFGDSVFIPAALGAYEIKGTCQLLKTYQPNVAKLDQEILNLVNQEG
jgi:mannose-6-phosphate isomerase